MFKKLKDKIAEEVKSSPQRIVELAQTVQNSYGTSNNGVSSSKQKPSNSGQFSITEEETPQNSPNKVGFTNVSLVDSNMVKTRRDSNSSIASDVSLFLPKYESANNLYHLQSDLDISASEVEDNLQYSSQLENISKDNLYKAYNTMKAKYSKYRGRYSDLARHYRDLEREHTRTKSILVETQDKTLRRVSELKEQCSLEQTAKAHLEQELRIDLDEKQLTINALKQKVGLLQKAAGQPVNVSTNLDFKEADDSNSATDLINNEILFEDLKKAKCEIERLQKQLNEQTVSKLDHCNPYAGDEDISDSKKLIDLDTSIGLEQCNLSEVNVFQNMNTELLNQKLTERDEELKEKQMKINELMEKCKKSGSVEQELQNVIAENFNLKLQIENSKQTANESEKHSLEIENYVHKLTESEKKYESVLQKISQLEKDLESKEYEIEMLNHKISNQNKSSKMEEDLRQKEIDNQIEQLENKEKSLIESNEHLKKKLDATQSEVNNLKLENKKNVELFKQQLQNTELKLNDIEWTCDKGKQELHELKSALKSKESEILELNVAKCEMVQLKEELNEEIDNLKTQVETLIKEKSELKSYITDIENKKEICEREILELRRTVENYQASKELFSKQIHDMSICNNELHIKVSDLEKEQNVCQNKIAHLTTELSTLNNEKEGLQNEMSEIESLSLFKNSENTQVNYLIDDINETIKVLASEKHNYEKQIVSLMSDNKAFYDKIQTLSKKCEEYAKQTDSMKAELEKTNLELLNSKQIIFEKELHTTNVSHKGKELLEKEMDDLKLVIDNLNVEKLAFSKEVELLEIQNNELHKTNTSLKLENEKLLAHNNSLKLELDTEVNKNEQNITDIIEIENKLTLMNANMADKQNEIKGLVSQLASDKIEKEKLQLQLKEQMENNNQLIKKVTLLSTELEKGNCKLNNLHEKNAELAQKIDCLICEKNELASELICFKTNFDELKIKNVEISEELNTLRESNNEIINLKSELKTKHDELIVAENKISELLKLNDDQNVNILNLTKQITEIEKQNENLKYLDEKLKTTESHNNEINLKLKEKDDESIKLLHEIELLKKNEAEDIKILKDRIIDLENYIELKNKELEILDEKNFEIKSLTQEISDVHAELEQKNKEIDKLKESIKDYISMETEIKSLSELHITLKNDMSNKDRQIESLNETIVSLENNNVSNVNQISELTQQLVESRGEYDISKKRFNYYESEIEKLHNRNQKLTEKLDETLIILNHTSQFESDGTEMEYLRNILYSYMTGKESLILAKVIAAVCKFTQEQTNVILQRETQKQTLLGQLGFA